MKYLNFNLNWGARTVSKSTEAGAQQMTQKTRRKACLKENNQWLKAIKFTLLVQRDLQWQFVRQLLSL